MSIVKPKLTYLVQPITKDTDSTVNQSKFEVITRSWREARENVIERVTIGFGFATDWMRKLARVLHASLAAYKVQNQLQSNLP